MKEYNFFFFLNIFLNRWKWILLYAVLFMAGAWGLCKYCVKPIYASNVTIFCGRIMPPESSATTNGSNTTTTTTRQALNEYSNSLYIGAQLVNDYQELLKSGRIREKVLHEINPDGKNENFYSTMTANAIRQTHILSIEVRTHDPKLSQDMANAYGEAFLSEVQTIMQMQNSQIVDPAKLPQAPISPKTTRISILCFFLGGILSYLGFLLMNLLDFTIKAPEEASSLLNQPILGAIPQIDALNNHKYQGSAIFAAGGDAVGNSIADYFRSARVNLQYSQISKKGQALVYLVTSTIPAEGKSFTASNLAVAMADSGKKVLLINCDLRKPSLQKIFKIHPKIGLVNYLIGEKSFDEIVTQNVLNLPLDVIFCGPIPPNPAKLIGSDEFAALIEAERTHYDYIFLDMPPVLATADAVLIGKSIDAVLFVVRARYVHTALVMQALTELKQAKMNIAGIILNRYRTASSRHGYSYGYGYRYGYGYGYRYGYGYGNKSEKKTGGIAGLFHRSSPQK